MKLSLGLIVILALPASAHARRVPLPSPVPPIVRAPCPAYPEAGGCAMWSSPFTIYVVGSRFSLEHELGHAFDRTMLSDGERNRFRNLIGAKLTMPWWKKIEGELGAYSRTSLGEQFADAYANCAVGNGPYRKGKAVGWKWTQSTPYYPTPRLHKAVCAFIRRAGKKETTGLIPAASPA